MACYNSELPIGPQGPTGPQGPPGEDGASTLNVQTEDPTTTNDSSEGYEEGSTWFNKTTAKFFICSDATENAAVWNLIGGLSGSWTGTITGTTDITFVSNSGRYSVVNNIVTCSCRLQFNFSSAIGVGGNLSLPIPPSSLFNDNLQLIGVGSVVGNTGSETVTRIFAESQPGGINAYINLNTSGTNSDTFTCNYIIQYTI